MNIGDPENNAFCFFRIFEVRACSYLYYNKKYFQRRVPATNLIPFLKRK